MPREALGLIETKSLQAAMDAFHASSNAALVIASIELIDASFVVIKVEGEVGAVQAAVDAGAHAAQATGKLIAARIIPRPDGAAPHAPARKRSTTAQSRTPETRKVVSVDAPVLSPADKTSPARIVEKPAPPKGVAEAVASMDVAWSDLEAMPVVKLRQYARNLINLPIQGRQISMANKQQLLEAIKAAQR